MRKNSWLWGALLSLFFFTPKSIAQSYLETALTFSRTLPGGSARIQGIGGAQTSLGGDYSSVYSNPAGLGFFNRNEFTITPSLKFNQVVSNFNLGDTFISNNRYSRVDFTLPGISLVFHKDFTADSESVISGNFAIALNRINDFNSTFYYEGINKYSSIINAFINTANGQPNSQFGKTGSQFLTPTWLAFENYLLGDSSLIKVGGNPKSYFTDVTKLPYAPNGIPTQSEKVQTSGRQNQISIAYGVNIKDKFYLGGGIGITSLQFLSQKTYQEIFDTGPMSNLVMEESLTISGIGVNFTLGGIIKPTNFLQVGLSIATPSINVLTDIYRGTMNTSWKNYKYYLSPTDVSKFVMLNKLSANTSDVSTSYTLYTPWRWSGGITFMLNKKGFISLDIENINYASTSYKSTIDGVSFNRDNANIKTRYKSIFNVRTGAEYRYRKWRIRGGYNYMPNPSVNLENSNTDDINLFTLGAGFRISTFYIDIAVIRSQTNGSYTSYPIGLKNAPLIKNEVSNTQIMATVGFPF